MNEEVDLILEDAEDNMKNAISHLEKTLVKIRAGKANPRMLDGLQVDYYGTMTAISQVANIGTTDARTIVIQPWEKQMIQPIEKAIITSDLGLNPDNNGETIRVNIPVLTEERRHDLVKQIRHEGEEAKISIRNARRDTNDQLKKMLKDGLSEDMEKDAEAEVQKLTDNYSVKVEKLVEEKETDVMKV